MCVFLIGWNKRVDYEPGTGSKQLFPKMHLETCDGPLSSVRAMVELQTSHIGKGCDRETYSEKSLQKLCGKVNFSTNNLSAGPEPPQIGFRGLMGLICHSVQLANVHVRFSEPSSNPSPNLNLNNSANRI